MKTAYAIKIMEYLDVLTDDMIQLEDQGLEAQRAKGRLIDPFTYDWLRETYPGLFQGSCDDEAYSRYYGDGKSLRTLKYDLEYNLKPAAPKTPQVNQQALIGTQNWAGLNGMNPMGQQNSTYPTAQTAPTGNYRNPVRIPSMGPNHGGKP